MRRRDSDARVSSYGQLNRLSTVDRFGVWLSGVAVRRNAELEGARLGDIGCGYHATFACTQLDVLGSALLVDLKIANDVKRHSKVTALEGPIPEVLPRIPSASLDVTLCLSVLEHLWDPEAAVGELRRVTAPGGVVLLNVPSWLGKSALEFAAFRLGVSPAEEMDDHKWYFDPRDIWPMLVRAGFKPSEIRCRRHKFGLNTFAVCRVGPVTPGANRD